MNQTDIVKAAYDTDAARWRPGVPEEQDPHPMGHAHWVTPQNQPVTPGILKDPSRDKFTSTFGTGPTPAGLSGLLRRVAYHLPDYEVKRWALLLFADRVDSFEDRLIHAMKRPSTWGILAGASFVGLAAWMRHRGTFRS